MQKHGYKWLNVWFILFMSISTGFSQQFTGPIRTFGKYVTNGVSWNDYDNDGFYDIYMTNGFQSSSPLLWENFLYHNLGNGLFDSVSTAGSIESDVFLSAGSSWGDFDNDGDIDVIVGEPLTHSSGSGFFSTYFSETKVYQNNNDGTFTDLTSMGDLGNEISGGSTSQSHIGAIWVDYDNDGDLDVIESNATFLGGAQNFTMYRNNGDGTFTSISNNITAASSARAGFTAADFDEDGDIDIVTLAGNTGQNTTLWINTGTDFTETVLLSGGSTYNSQSATWLDYDGDGDLDLYIAIAGDDSNVAQPNELFRNDNGTLVQVTSGVGPIISDAYLTLVTAAADYDNDGDIDIYTGVNGDLTSSPAQHNALYTNNGSGVFTENTTTGIDTSGFAEGGSFADLDNDGDMDLMVGRQGKNYLYKNNGNSGTHWSEIECVGNGSTVNMSAIGALVKVTATINSSSKTQIRDVSPQTGRGSHNMLRTHFGLGDATYLSNITVRWPGPGTTTSYTDMPADKIMRYTFGTSTGTADVLASRTFLYLIGSSGGAVEFVSNTDVDGGTLTITRTDSDPGNAGYSGSATAPDGSTVTPNSVSNAKYWTMSESGLTGNYSARIYIDISGIAGVNNPDRLVILQRANSGSAWTPLNTSRTGNTLSTTGTVTTLGEFAIGSNTADNSLPVELSAFSLEAGDGKVVMNWKTASELENAGFVIERSVAGRDQFMEIASYQADDALKGQLYSNTETAYSFTDNSVVNGTTYTYRLWDVSLSGARTQLARQEARPMTVVSGYMLHRNYPNPFNPVTTILFDVPADEAQTPVKLTVYNSLGERIRVLFQGTLNSGSHRFEWDGTNQNGIQQASGVYILHATAGNRFSQTMKMLLVK
ncbi:MAG: T9SS C-terminal target domain-containing protein [Calditrichaeota bacterium]|nr:MAG: T9SS C-terminal target domain-containing protein [Calditrichota bacterium]